MDVLTMALFIASMTVYVKCQKNRIKISNLGGSIADHEDVKFAFSVFPN